jgi:lipoprotein-anchoring transpeptidase ErfK/SrfK
MAIMRPAFAGSAFVLAASIWCGAAQAQSTQAQSDNAMAYNDARGSFPLFSSLFPAQPQPVAASPLVEPDEPLAADSELPARLRRQIVAYSGKEPAGTIIVDTSNTYLYYVLGHGQAMRYGIGVGRDGFRWSGTKTIERKSEWPDWIPPAEMVARQPYLPRFVAGGPSNPLGARALYLAGTMYRIHGTNVPTSIGQRVSSGCIRMLNEDVIDLYRRANVGTRVVVLPDRRGTIAAHARSGAQPTLAAASRSRIY